MIQRDRDNMRADAEYHARRERNRMDCTGGGVDHRGRVGREAATEVIAGVDRKLRFIDLLGPAAASGGREK
jgi:hypothetical protein